MKPDRLVTSSLNRTPSSLRRGSGNTSYLKSGSFDDTQRLVSDHSGGAARDEGGFVVLFILLCFLEVSAFWNELAYFIFKFVVIFLQREDLPIFVNSYSNSHFIPIEDLLDALEVDQLISDMQSEIETATLLSSGVKVPYKRERRRERNEGSDEVGGVIVCDCVLFCWDVFMDWSVMVNLSDSIVFCVSLQRIQHYFFSYHFVVRTSVCSSFNRTRNLITISKMTRKTPQFLSKVHFLPPKALFYWRKTLFWKALPRVWRSHFLRTALPR